MTETKYLPKNDYENQQFLQFPKFLLTPEYKHLSSDAKIIYTCMKDRVSLSVKSGDSWYDDKGVFIYFTQKNIMETVDVSNRVASKIKKELLDCNLIEDKFQGINKPSKIYIKVPNESLSYDKPAKTEDVNICTSGCDCNETVKTTPTTGLNTGSDYSSRQGMTNSHTTKTESIKTLNTTVTEIDTNIYVKSWNELYPQIIHHGKNNKLFIRCNKLKDYIFKLHNRYIYTEVEMDMFNKILREECPNK
jgi:hypothetical protein